MFHLCQGRNTEIRKRQAGGYKRRMLTLIEFLPFDETLTFVNTALRRPPNSRRRKKSSFRSSLPLELPQKDSVTLSGSDPNFSPDSQAVLGVFKRRFGWARHESDLELANAIPVTGLPLSLQISRNQRPSKRAS